MAKPATVPGRRIPPHSEALVLAGRLFTPIIILFGLYVVLHATVTPGGGFQGGVIIASGVLLLFLCEGYVGWRGFMRVGLARRDGRRRRRRLRDRRPGADADRCRCICRTRCRSGQLKAMLSGGLMLILNWGVAFAVAGGFGVLFVEFLEETRAEDPGESTE